MYELNPLDQARVDVCNIVKALTGEATRLEFTHVHEQGVLARAMLEVASEMAQERDVVIDLSENAGPLCGALLDLVAHLALTVRGVHRVEISKQADLLAFNTAALHPLDLAPSGRKER